MRKRKRADWMGEGEAVVDVSSLIDVCFLLLVFFMVTVTIAPRESDLELKLPG